MKLYTQALCASAFLSAPALALPGVSFAGNITLPANQDFSARASSFRKLNLGPLYTGVYWSSFSASADAGVTGSAASNGLFGAVYTQLATPPSVFLSYYDVAADWSLDLGSFNADVDVTGSAAFIGSVYLSLDEVKPDKTQVQSFNLGRLAWTAGDVQTTDAGKGLKTVTFTGKKHLIDFTQPDLKNLEVKITVIVADQYGTLNTGAVITPKSMETVLEITGFNYVDTANSIKLRAAVATAKASATAKATAAVQVGDLKRLDFNNLAGKAEVYFDARGDCNVNGATTPTSATVTFDAAGTADLNNDHIKGQVIGKAGGTANAEVQIMSVVFPAGAQTIVYDPTIGQGTAPVYAPTVSGAQAGVAPLAGLISLLVMLQLQVR